jgi:hypothetical protein
LRRPRSIPIAYTLATPNAVARYAPSTMCEVSVAHAGLNIAASGSTWVTRPPTIWKPRGTFIHALAVTMKNADATAEIAIGKPDSQWARGESRFHP